jgi:ATP-dependent DNA ligase
MTSMPSFVKPMLAKLSALPVDESQWAFEVKWDGIRARSNRETDQAFESKLW